MNIKPTIMVAVLGGLLFSAQAGLTHRYTFDDNTDDVVGSVASAPTTGSYVSGEAPLFVADTPAGAIGGAPAKSMELGMNWGTKKSGFEILWPGTLSDVGSYSLWFKADEERSGAYIMFAPTPGLIAVQYGSNLNLHLGTSALGLPFAVGEWNHLAMTWDASAEKTSVYLNGNIMQSDADTGAVSMTAGARIGNYDVGDNGGNLANQFDGHLYDMQFYDQALSAGEVAQLEANPGSVIPEPATLGLMVAMGGVMVFSRRLRM